MFGQYRSLTVKEGLGWLKTGAPSRETMLLPHPTDYFDLDFEEHASRYRMRGSWVHTLSFAIPCLEAMECLKARSVVEVGAGTGYWSSLIALHGGDIIATDIETGISGYRHHIGAFHGVEQLSATEAATRYPDRDVLTVWPNYDESWAYEMACTIEGDRLLHYVGEGYGGCTADDDFHTLMSREFDQISEVAIPQWEGIHDYLTTYRRKR
jgi:hypothetical protein